MKRLLIVFTILLFALQPPTAQAAPSLKEYDTNPNSGSQPQIVWELKSLGRLSADMQFAPNGQILLPLANQLASVDTQGELQWSVKIAGGKAGCPACSEDGSIYDPTSSSIQEIRPDGASGWAFTVYPAASGATNQWLGYGQGTLYLPLASGLYILDLNGHLVSLAPWDSSELQPTQLPSSYNFMDGTVTAYGCYAIVSTDTNQYQMSVFNAKGDYLWDYGLGGLNQAYVAAGDDGTVFLADAPSTIDRVNNDMISSFAPNSSQPQWQTSIDENTTFLGLSLAATGNLYLALAGKIYALDAKTGTIKWNVLFTNLASPVAVDDKTGYIYAGCSDGSLIAVDPTGKLSWDMSLGSSSISLKPLVGADGFLYVDTNSGNLYKIQLPSSDE